MERCRHGANLLLPSVDWRRKKKQMAHGVLSWWIRTPVGHTVRSKKNLLVNSINPQLKKKAQEKESTELCTRVTKKDVKAKEYGNIESLPNTFLGIEIRPRIRSSLSVVTWLTCPTSFPLDCYKWVTFITSIRAWCLARRAGYVKASTRWSNAQGALDRAKSTNENRHILLTTLMEVVKWKQMAIVLRRLRQGKVCVLCLRI